MPLFRRRDRALTLTEAGRAYFPPVRSAFRQIVEATRRVNSASGGPVLTVSAPPAFAAVWLVPRLGAFQARHPAIDVRLSTSRALADLEAGGTDIAIRHGSGRWKGLRADRIVTAALVPVCNSALLRGRPPPSRAEELASLPLLHDGQRQDWPLWFQAHDVQPVPREAFSGPSFDDQMLLLRAAAAGQGVALVTEALARPELASGLLARALDLPLSQELRLLAGLPTRAAEQPKIAAFRDWVLAEGAPIRLPIRSQRPAKREVRSGNDRSAGGRPRPAARYRGRPAAPGHPHDDIAALQPHPARPVAALRAAEQEFCRKTERDRDHRCRARSRSFLS